MPSSASVVGKDCTKHLAPLTWPRSCASVAVARDKGPTDPQQLERPMLGAGPALSRVPDQLARFSQHKRAGAVHFVDEAQVGRSLPRGAQPVRPGLWPYLEAPGHMLLHYPGSPSQRGEVRLEGGPDTRAITSRTEAPKEQDRGGAV